MSSRTVTFGQSGSRPYGVLTVKQTATSIANNSSTVSATLVLKRPSSVSSSATKTASMTINGTKYSWSGTIGGSGDKTLISKTLTIPHNADGKKTISLNASIGLDITWSGVSLGTISGSGSLVLDAIPRYATANQSLSAKTETTATIAWSSDSTIDYVWYSTTNGSTWSGINVADGKSGTYTISGLSANTSYQVKTRVRNKSSKLTTDSSAMTVTTYSFPYASSMPNFTIGERLTIGFYNPLGRSITINLLGADGSVCGTDTISGTTISGYNNSTVQGRLYSSIPNAKSGTYSVKVTYGSSVITKAGGTYTVDAAACKPIIGGATYKDINSTITAITGNNQQIVQNKSQVQFAASGLQAQNYAAVSSVSVSVNGNSYRLTVSGTNASGGSAVINSGTDVQAVVTVTDTRGLTASKSVNVTMLALANPTAIITLQRQSNFYAATDIKVDSDYSSVSGKNTISISYACIKDGTTAASVTGTLQDNVQKTITLDNTKGWTVKVTLVDRFGMATTYSQYVSRGMPIIYFDKDKSSVGVNCFPQAEETLEIDGAISATGNISGNVITIGNGSSVAQLNSNNANRNGKVIAVHDSGKSYGDIVEFGAGGNVLIGAGESAENLYKGALDNSAAASENLYLLADGSTFVYSNANAIANRNKWTFGTDGTVTAPSGNHLAEQGVKVLWSGGPYYMMSTHSCTLSENVSNQSFGIVLHWQYYLSGAVQNSDHHYTFIPKSHVAKFNGGGVVDFWVAGGGAYACRKYVYVSNGAVKGNDNNNSTAAGACGITYSNNRWVLSQILGV